MNTVANSLPAGAARGSLRAWFARTRAAAWEAMQLAAWARAQAQLIEFADRCEANQPALARELRSAAKSGPMV